MIVENEANMNECKAIIIVGGGSRGLGKSLLDIYQQSGYKGYAFHKREKIANVKNKFLDIDIRESIEYAREEINEICSKAIHKQISIHFVSGGGLGRNDDNSSMAKCEDIIMHNYLLPAYITDSLTGNKRAMGSTKKSIELNYYSSAVTQHLKGDEHYIGAKAALESYFKSKFVMWI